MQFSVAVNWVNLHWRALQGQNLAEGDPLLKDIYFLENEQQVQQKVVEGAAATTVTPIAFDRAPLRVSRPFHSLDSIPSDQFMLALLHSSGALTTRVTTFLMLK